MLQPYVIPEQVVGYLYMQVVRLLPVKPATDPMLQPNTVPAQRIYRDSANFYQILPNSVNVLCQYKKILKACLYKQVAGILRVSCRLFICRQTRRRLGRANYDTTANLMLQPYSVLVRVQFQVTYMQPDIQAVGQSQLQHCC